MNIEHFVVFLITGIISILLLALLAYATSFGTPGNAPSIDFIVNEAQSIGANLFPMASVLFLLLVGTMLFATQFAVMDSTSRIISENIILTNPSRFSTRALPKAYYSVLWAQIVFGVLVFMMGIKDPLFLITLSAIINAIAMFVHIGLTFLLNTRTLPCPTVPSIWRKSLLVGIFIFFGVFSFYTLWGYFLK